MQAAENEQSTVKREWKRINKNICREERRHKEVTKTK